MKPRPSRATSTSVFSPIQWAPAHGDWGGGGEGGALRSVERPPRHKNGHETHELKGLLFHSHGEALERSPRARRQVWQEGLSPCQSRGFQPLPRPGEPPEPAARAGARPGGCVGSWVGRREGGKGEGRGGGARPGPDPRRRPRTRSRSARGPGPGAGSVALFLRLVPGPRPCPLPRAYNPGCAPQPALLHRLPPPPPASR